MARGNREVTTAVSLQSLTKHYQDVTVVDNVNIDLARGEFLSLLGPSGSGKTTILRMVAGLIQNDRGRVVIDGRDTSDIPANKRNLGMVFQQYALFPHMTVWDNVAYGLKARKVDRRTVNEKVQYYLELVGLNHLSDRKPRALSGGQQQRVSLARALAVEPVVMLFDEPLSNLDVRLREQMQQEIYRLHQELGFTAIYVTHDQSEALYLSDKIAVINQGIIEQAGDPGEILTRPASPFVADFFGYNSRLTGAELIDNERAKVGGITVPVGYVGQEVPAGARGVLMLRKNAVQIVDYDDVLRRLEPSEDDMFQAELEVAGTRYLGGETEFKLKLKNGGDDFITTICPKLIQPLPMKGQTVKVRFEPSAIIFFKSD